MKLSRIRGKAALLLTSLPLAVFSAENPGADWPQFLGPTRNGHYAGPSLTNTWPKEGPAKLWEKKVGQGFSSPVLAGGKLVLFHRVADNETIECLNPKNGQTFWKVEYPTGFRDEIRSEDDGPRSTPAIFENQVFTFGAEGMLNCLKLATGEKIWSVDTRAKFGAGTGFFGMACSPLVEGRAVLLNVGGRDQAGIVAFDRMNGKVLWKTSDDEASYSSPVAATIHGQRYAFFFTRNHLSALNPGTGKVAFDFPWSPKIHASVSAVTPLILDDLIFISASYGAGAALLRFRESGPERLWSGDDILSNHYSTSVHHDGFLYGFDGRQEQGCNLRCVELKSGKVRWSKDAFGAGTILLVNDQLLILTEKGQLMRALATPAEFKPNAQAQVLPYNVRAYPALANGFLYARNKDKLVCLDLRGEP